MVTTYKRNVNRFFYVHRLDVLVATFFPSIERGYVGSKMEVTRKAPCKGVE
jgi:hypothetical protein